MAIEPGDTVRVNYTGTVIDLLPNQGLLVVGGQPGNLPGSKLHRSVCRLVQADFIPGDIIETDDEERGKVVQVNADTLVIGFRGLTDTVQKAQCTLVRRPR